MCRQRRSRRSATAEEVGEPPAAPACASKRVARMRAAKSSSTCTQKLAPLVSFASAALLLLCWGDGQGMAGLRPVHSQDIGGGGGGGVRRKPPPSQLELLGMDPVADSAHRFTAKKEQNVFDHQEVLNGGAADRDDVLDEVLDYRAQGTGKSKGKSKSKKHSPDSGGKCKLKARCYRFCNAPKKQCGKKCMATEKLCWKKGCACHLKTCEEFCQGNKWREYCRRRGISRRRCRRHKQKCGCAGRNPDPPPPPTRPPRERPTSGPTKSLGPTPLQCTPKCERFCNKPSPTACETDPECLQKLTDCGESCGCRPPVTCERYCSEWDVDPRAACDNQGWSDNKCRREAESCDCRGPVPTLQPITSRSPGSDPTSRPSRLPVISTSLPITSEPTPRPPTTSRSPSSDPSSRPSLLPSASPSGVPSKQQRTDAPSSIPSERPTIVPFESPSSAPSLAPSANPSQSPSSEPSQDPSALPSGAPSLRPSSSPSVVPSDAPSTLPSPLPSMEPSLPPSETPSDIPSTSPSDGPSAEPSAMPSDSPSRTPSSAPSTWPSDGPSAEPSTMPSDLPSRTPSSAPSFCGVPGGACVSCCKDGTLECRFGPDNPDFGLCLDPLPAPSMMPSPQCIPGTEECDPGETGADDGCPGPGGKICCPGEDGAIFRCYKPLDATKPICAEDGVVSPAVCPVQP